jgi:hypothetical protein
VPPTVVDLNTPLSDRDLSANGWVADDSAFTAARTNSNAAS